MTASELPRLQQESARSALASETRTKGRYNKHKIIKAISKFAARHRNGLGRPAVLEKTQSTGTRES